MFVVGVREGGGGKDLLCGLDKANERKGRHFSIITVHDDSGGEEKRNS